MLDALENSLSAHFYLFGVRGALLVQLERPDEARVAFVRALALARSPAEAAHVRMQIDRLTRTEGAQWQRRE